MKKYLFRNILWCLVIFVLCTLPGDDLPKNGLQIPHLDKFVHFTMFYIMSILLCAELRFQTNLSYKRIMLISISLVVFYGAAIELLQNYVFVYRSGDYYDLLFDALGGILGALSFKPLRYFKNKILRKKPFCNSPFLRRIF
jgi:VanZ family protein